MSVNLMQLVKSGLKDHASTIATIVDADGPTIAATEDYAVSAIVAGLTEKSKSGSGADAIFDSLDDFDGILVDQLGGLLQGGNHPELLRRGASVLAAIFGDKQSGLLDILARVGGIAPTKMSTLMGLLAPIVMSVLGRQRRESGLDAGGVANLLNSQSDYLSLPDECAAFLNLGDNVAPATDAVTPAASAHVPTSSGTTPPQPAAAESSASVMVKTLLPLAILGVLVYAAFSAFLSGNGGAVGSGAGITVPEIALPGFDGKSMADAFGTVTEAVASVRDKETAAEAVKTIEAAGAVFDAYDLEAIAGTDQKDAVGTFFNEGVSGITALLDEAYGNPEAKDVMQPALDRFLTRFEVFGG